MLHLRTAVPDDTRIGLAARRRSAAEACLHETSFFARGDYHGDSLVLAAVRELDAVVAGIDVDRPAINHGRHQHTVDIDGGVRQVVTRRVACPEIHSRLQRAEIVCEARTVAL